MRRRKKLRGLVAAIGLVTLYPLTLFSATNRKGKWQVLLGATGRVCIEDLDPQEAASVADARLWY